MKTSTSFLTQYAAVRFGTGHRPKGVATPLLKAACLLVYCVTILPIHLLSRLLTIIQHRLDDAPPPPRPTFPSGRPQRFADSVADLQEDMLQ